MNNKNTLTVLKNDELNYDSYIVFCLNSHKYAINIQHVIEVVNIPYITMPVASPKGVIGMFDYNGMIIKAIDLCPLIGIPTNKFSVNNQLIIFVVDGNFGAIHTEYIENIIRINRLDLSPFPFGIENSFISSVYKNDDVFINIIDVVSLEKTLENNKSVKSEIDYSVYLPSDENSLKILNDRTNQFKENNDVFAFSINQHTVNQYIMFDLGCHSYFMDIKYVKEFVSINSESITPLPYTKKFIKGLVSIRGEFLVVLDLKCFLNDECVKNSETAKIIVIKGNDYNIAFLVDDIKYIKTLKQQSFVNSDKNLSSFILAEFEENNTLYSILNVEKIINDESLYINY